MQKYCSKSLASSSWTSNISLFFLSLECFITPISSRKTAFFSNIFIIRTIVKMPARDQTLLVLDSEIDHKQLKAYCVLRSSPDPILIHYWLKRKYSQLVALFNELVKSIQQSLLSEQRFLTFFLFLRKGMLKFWNFADRIKLKSQYCFISDHDCNTNETAKRKSKNEKRKFDKTKVLPNVRNNFVLISSIGEIWIISKTKWRTIFRVAIHRRSPLQDLKINVVMARCCFVRGGRRMVYKFD